MLKIENDIQNYNSLNFKSKKFVGRRKLPLKQIMKHSAYNTNQVEMGNMTGEEYLIRTYSLIKKLLPVKCSLKWHINNKSKIDYIKKTLFDVQDTLNELNMIK